MMGTRSLTVFKEQDGTEIAVMYRQFDGYPSGHGEKLAEFCANRKITNGISFDDDKTANGMSCLAAMIVAHFKTKVGEIYLHPAGTRDCWEDYVYTVSGSVGTEPNIKCEYAHGGEILYDGPASKFEVIESGEE